MKKIISLLVLFIISANTLFAQPPNRKVKPKKPNNYQTGSSSGGDVVANPQTQAKGADVAMDNVRAAKPKAKAQAGRAADSLSDPVKPKQRRKG